MVLLVFIPINLDFAALGLLGKIGLLTGSIAAGLPYLQFDDEVLRFFSRHLQGEIVRFVAFVKH